jgi:hypothetical protein
MMIREKEIWREAGRNLACGASRTIVAVLLLAATLGALGWAQAASVVDLARQAKTYRESGAAIRLVVLHELIDGAQCDKLNGYPGIAAAGATRTGSSLSLAAMPARKLETVEATPGLAKVLGLDAKAANAGVWLSSDLAGVLGISQAGVDLPLADGTVSQTSAIYQWADNDGRPPTLAYTIVQPVPAQGKFDTCWVELWPEGDTADAVLTLPALAGPPDPNTGQRQLPQVEQLNTTLGWRFDALGKLAKLPTDSLTLAGVLIGLVLGAGLIRSRRLELAAALHAGVPKTALVGQIMVEIFTIGLCAACLAVPTAIYAAKAGNPDPPWPALFPALRTVALAVLAAVLGALLITLATREKHLFRHFKNR